MIRRLKILLVFTLALAITVGASFADTTDPLKNGTPSSWAIENIKTLSTYGQLRQSAFTNYQGEITRLDFIYLAVTLYEKLNQTEIVVNSSIHFTDTADLYAMKGATIGITSGTGGGKFGPTDLLTREQMATMMVKVLTLSNIKLETSKQLFKDDSDISGYAKESIYQASNYGIITGFDNNVTPKGNAKIEQVLLIYKNMYDTFSKQVIKPVTFKTKEEIQDYLVENYPNHELNGTVITFDSYQVVELSSGGLAINATMEKDNFREYLKAEQLGQNLIAKEVKNRADVFSKLLGKNITLSYVYSYYQTTYPSEFTTNYIYDNAVFFDNTVDKWGIYYPLIATFSNQTYYLTYRASYNYQ